jgi:hypothetical protein
VRRKLNNPTSSRDFRQERSFQFSILVFASILLDRQFLSCQQVRNTDSRLMYAYYESKRTQHLHKDAPVTRVKRASVYRTASHERCREPHTSKIEETPMNRDFQRDAMFLLRLIAMSDKKRN